ncbi:MAG: hypothetical protein CL891_01190 [Dehalococcoidia bacterium]|nr:hypothetical protein [Dehalococcoidia bacterium]
MDSITKTLSKIEYLHISILGFGLAALSTSLAQIILPIRILDISPDQLKNTYLGILTFSGMSVAMLTQPVVGYLSDRTSLGLGRRKPYILGGAILSTTLTLSLGVASSYILIVIVYIFIQVGINVAQNPYDAMVKDQVPHNQRGQVSATRAISGGAGAITLVLLTGLLMDNHLNGLQDKWLWISLIIPSFTLCFTMVWILTKVDDGFLKQQPEPQNQGNREETNMPHPHFYVFLVAGFFFTLAAGILQTYTLFFLTDVVKLDNPASAIGILAAVVGATILITLYPAGLLSDRLGRSQLLIVSGIKGSICSLLLCFSQNLTHVLLIGILMGVSIGVFMSAGRALITDLASKSQTATHLGIANLVLVGGLAVSKLGGIAIDSLNNIQVDLGYYVLLGISSASFAIGTVLVSILNKKVGTNFKEISHSSIDA